MFGLNKGEVFGPYKDGNTLRISRMIEKKRDGNLNKVLIADIVKEIIPSNESSNTNYRLASQAEFDANNNLPLNNSDASLFIDSFFPNIEKRESICSKFNLIFSIFSCIFKILSWVITLLPV